MTSDAARVLDRSTIIECSAGDHVLKKGGVARNLFVVALTEAQILLATITRPRLGGLR